MGPERGKIPYPPSVLRQGQEKIKSLEQPSITFLTPIYKDIYYILIFMCVSDHSLAVIPSLPHLQWG